MLAPQQPPTPPPPPPPVIALLRPLRPSRSAVISSPFRPLLTPPPPPHYGNAATSPDGHPTMFWNDLPPQARQELLKLDKQTLIEQACKNLYCSRCNGLLLESFAQIVMYGKSLQQEVLDIDYLSTTDESRICQREKD